MKTMRLVFILALAFARSVAAVDAPENSYPDKPLGAEAIKVTSFTDWAEKFRKYTGKEIVLPSGVAATIAKYPALNARFGGSMSTASGTISLRDYLGWSREITGMEWHYDPASGKFVFIFPWEAKDDRPNAQLLKIM